MKKFALMMLALLVIFISIGITACGGGGEESAAMTTQAQTQQKPTTTAAATTTKPASGDSGSWGIPIYPGAKETFKIKSDKDEILNDKPAVLEHRVYTTSDKRDKVVAFYKDKMPANGWDETMWSEIGSGSAGISMGQYDKNSGQELAIVSCSDNPKDGGTVLNLDWKYVK